MHRGPEVERVGSPTSCCASAIVCPSEGYPVNADAEEGQTGLGGDRAPGSASDVATTIGATRLGSSSLNRMRRVGTPMTWAACTNSRSRSDSTCPRIRRVSAHPAEDHQDRDQREELDPVQSGELARLLEALDTRIGAMARAPSRNGKERKRSVTNMMSPVEPAAREAGDAARGRRRSAMLPTVATERSAGRCAGRRGGARGCRHRCSAPDRAGGPAQNPWLGGPWPGRPVVEVEHVGWRRRAPVEWSGRCSSPC